MSQGSAVMCLGCIRRKLRCSKEDHHFKSVTRDLDSQPCKYETSILVTPIKMPLRNSQGKTLIKGKYHRKAPRKQYQAKAMGFAWCGLDGWY